MPEKSSQPSEIRPRSDWRLKLALLELPKARYLVVPGLVLALIAAMIVTFTWITATGHRISDFPANRDCTNYGKGAWVCGPVERRNAS